MAKAAAALLACTAITPFTLPAAAQSSRVARPLSEAAAQQAADQILEAVRQRDGALRYSQFSKALQTTSSPSMVQGTLLLKSLNHLQHRMALATAEVEGQLLIS